MLSIALCAHLAGCSSAAGPIPASVMVGGSPPPVHRVLQRANDAPPEINWVWFDSLDVARGRQWRGQIQTTSNVASVEVRSNLFSIVARRADFGRFSFATDVFDVPSIFIRAYKLRVIARNTAGVEAEVDVPFRIR